MTRLRTLSCLYCRHSSQHVPDTLLSGFSTLRCPNFRHRPSCSFFIQDHVKIPNTLSYIFQALRCLSFGQYSVRFTDNNVSVEILNSIVSVFPDTLRNTYQTLPCLVSRQSELHISNTSPRELSTGGVIFLDVSLLCSRWCCNIFAITGSALLRALRCCCVS